jgi:hypothetical protein
LEETNKYSRTKDTRLRRIARDLRGKAARPGRILYGQMLRGAAYSIGSGAVSIIILWIEARR